MGDALAAGRIGVGQADRLAKANSHPQAKARFGEFVDVLVDHGEHFSMKEFEVIVGRFESNADPDGNPPDDNDANATVSAGAHGVNAKVTGGTALQGAEMKAVFDIAVEAEFQIDVAARRAEFGDAASDHPLLRTAAQRRFAAEYAIHLAYVSAPPGSVRPEPIVNIVFSAGLAGRTIATHGLTPDGEVFAGSEWGIDDGDDLMNVRCETSTGIPLDPHTALRAMIRGQVRRVVIDAHDVVVNMGALRRCFTGKARTAAQLLAITCSFPGCDIAAEFCEVDHVRRHTDGGPTDQHNGTPECKHHNLRLENAKLRSRRAKSGRIYMVRPDGTTILPAGEREPEWDDPHWDDPNHSPPEPPSQSIKWDEFVRWNQTLEPAHRWIVHRISHEQLLRTKRKHRH